MPARVLPYQHLSVRVPWHDDEWRGSICNDPLANGACLRLTRIAEARNDGLERRLAGTAWADLAQGELPPCAAERADFMSPTPRSVTKRHPYADWNDVYRKFLPTTYELPAFAADCVPFRWMLREQAAVIADQYQLPYEPALEEGVDQEAHLNNPAWVQHGQNQQLLLDTFFSVVKAESTLLFFYAKETPLSEDPRRVLVGVGRARVMGEVVPYTQDSGGFGSTLWERVIQHSVRPSMEDGFLVPYHELLKLKADSCDPAEHVVLVPDEFGMQFSYASEHVTHDAALSLLLALDRAVEEFSPLVSGSWSSVRQWLSERIGEIWTARGPHPGLGAALTAFGIPEGVLLSYAAQSRLNDNEDPWPLIDKWIRDPSVDLEAKQRVGPTTSQMWGALSDERRALLTLLSRFDLTTGQTTRLYQRTERDKAGIAVTDADIIANPYLVYETSRFTADPIAVGAVDRGVFPADTVRLTHPLPAPSRLDEAVDPRRVRALAMDVLEQAAGSGDSLQSQGSVIQKIRDDSLSPPCPVSVDLMAVCESHLPPEVVTVAMANGESAYQLERLSKARQSIARIVNRRRKGQPLAVDAVWRAVIDDELNSEVVDDDEELARQEKAAALEVLATSRVSVLIGAAGTGKTTLLRALTTLPAVARGGLLLLAPTGKARVRMQEAIKQGESNPKAETLAQFLWRMRRYDSETGRYHRSDYVRDSSRRTIVVDECSMLTEEALDALLDAIEGYDRLILVGDPRQLPPIGVGRPFVDIVQHLSAQCGTLVFPRIGPSYAELTIRRRQIGEARDAHQRADLMLAEWFAGDDPSPGADEVWDLVQHDKAETVSVRRWDSAEQLHEALRMELAKSLPEMSHATDTEGFQRSYGGEVHAGHVYFNTGTAGSAADSWQILSPVRADAGGVNELNRMLQRTYRKNALDLARNTDNDHGRRVPKPAGPQEIVYGDKVINLRNKKRKYYYPASDNVMEYVANGEIGVVTGPFKSGRRNIPLNRLEVEFSTQCGTAYKFWPSEFGGDDGSPVIELAYAITIHKAQGSEFERTFVILPNPCGLLSRELLYTALTRQREHIVLLHEGDLQMLKQYSNAAYSETAARITNIFAAPEPVEVDGKFLESKLIHRTRKGIAVRSKSELVIADLLYSKHIEFEYERPLVAGDGSWRSPDFTITDDGGTTFYWEHLGMLQRPSYRQKWEKKLAWYRDHGILPFSERAGPNGTLVTTEDGPDGSISSADIEALVDEVLG